jgi:signal transduction histidine kinase
LLVAGAAWLGAGMILLLGGSTAVWGRLALGAALVLILPGLSFAWLRQRQPRAPVSQPSLAVLARTTEIADLTQNSGEVIRPLREEIARILIQQPRVVLAATLAGPGFQTSVNDTDTDNSKRGSFWRRGDEGPTWQRLSRSSKSLFDQARLKPDQLIFSGPGTELTSCGLPAELVQGCDSWLMMRVGSPDQIPLLVLLGLGPGADTERLAALLAEMSTMLAPVLAVHHHLTLTRSQVDAARAENEALGRFNKMQGEFVAVASHELKTPLTSIGAYTEVLLQNVANPDFAPRQEFLTIIKSESDRLLRMVNRILDFAKLEFSQRLLERELVALCPLVEDTVATLEPQLASKRQKLIIACPEDLPLVEVDKDLIRQVLINLISNAIKYSPEAGEITVRASEDAATVRVDIQDTGPGIPADELRSIFRQFYRVRSTSGEEEGAGLGLTIVKNIIDLHDGHVDVKSREGFGATFSCHLPKEYIFNNSPVSLLGELMALKQFQQIVRLGVRMVAELTESRVVIFSLLDAHEQDLIIHAALGIPAQTVQSFRINRNTGFMGRAVKTGQPQLGTTAEAAGIPVSAQAAADDPALAVAPLVIGNRTIGVVSVANKMDGTPYASDELNLLVTLCERFSAALGAALSHRTDHQRLDEIVEAMQALVKMKRSSIPTVNPLALRLMNRTASVLGFSPAEIKRLQYLVALHDAGMVRVDEEIVQKAGMLNEDERDEVDSHVVKGADLMSPLLLNSDMKEIILTHHEWMDGSGYPDGRAGVAIPLGSRILAVLDAFFAMIQSRPYRDRIPPAEVVKEIRCQAGKQFDPMVVDCFLNVLQEEGIIARQDETESTARDAASTPGNAEEKTWLRLES